jgi:hypothetical protein
MHRKALALAVLMALMMLGAALVGDSQIAFAQANPDPTPPDSLVSILNELVQRLLALLGGL